MKMTYNRYLMIVSADDFELPIGVYDSVRAISIIWGVSVGSVKKALYRGSVFQNRFRIIEVFLENSL